MPGTKKRIDEFAAFQIPREQWIMLRGKNSPHFFIDGVMYHNQLADGNSKEYRNAFIGEMAEPATESMNLGAVFKRFYKSILDKF